MRTYLANFLGILAAILIISVLSAGSAQAFGTSTLVKCPQDDLQQAIDNAIPNSTIKIKGECVGQFIVDKNLKLVGVGYPKATLNGNAAGTVLTIEAGATVVVKKLKITNGKNDDGNKAGGITVNGDARLYYTKVVENESTGTGTDGATSPAGGIVVNGSGSLKMVGGKLSKNEAGTGQPVSGAGGLMVDENAIAELHGVLIFKNMANGNSGGAIRTNTDSTLTMRGVKVIGNTTTPGVAAGGVYTTVRTILTILDSLIADNKTEGLGGFTCAGGLFLSTGVQATIRNTKVINNIGGGTECVGGIRLNFQNNLDATKLKVSGNRGAVGGIILLSDDTVTLRKSLVVGNRAPADGTGGIEVVGGTVTLLKSLIAANKPNNCVGFFEPGCF